MLLGNTYLEIEDGTSAAEQFLLARKDGALDSFVIAPLARTYVLQEQYEEALRELGKADKYQFIAAQIGVIRGDARLALKHFAKGEIACLRCKAEEALPRYDRAIKLAPRFVAPCLARARIIIDWGKHLDAEPDILAIRGIDVQNLHAAFLHALILARKDKAVRPNGSHWSDRPLIWSILLGGEKAGEP